MNKLDLLKKIINKYNEEDDLLNIQLKNLVIKL